MSAAEPANPTPPAVNTAGDAAVIDLTGRRLSGRMNRAATAARGRWTRMTDSTRPPGPHSDRDAALAAVANDVEMTFDTGPLDGIPRTLTDEETAAVYVLTLTLVERALESAAVNGIIDEAQHEELAVLIGGMKQAPRLV